MAVCVEILLSILQLQFKSHWARVSGCYTMVGIAINVEWICLPLIIHQPLDNYLQTTNPTDARYSRYNAHKAGEHQDTRGNHTHKGAMTFAGPRAIPSPINGALLC